MALGSNHISGFRACAELVTSDTEARLWNPDAPATYDEVLDDQRLEERLAEISACLNETQALPDNDEPGSPKFMLLMVPIRDRSHFTDGQRSIALQPKHLASIMRIAGVDDLAASKFWNSILPTVCAYTQYHDDGETPISITVLIRCPRLSNGVICVMRIQLRTMDCFALIPTNLARDREDIIRRCERHLGLLRKHPFYLLSFILDNRFLRWTDWIADLWRTLVEVETVAGMTNPQWRLRQADVERLASLADPDYLIGQLHATQMEFCHSDTVMTFALKLAAFCTKALAEAEDGRKKLGRKTLSERDRRALDQDFAATLTRYECMRDRLAELKRRIDCQINAAFNLIAQRDSKINFAIAKMQAHDSRTVRAIGVLTLVFLPATFLAVSKVQLQLPGHTDTPQTLWSANVIEIEGERNWHIFLAVVIALTVIVFLCWGIYGHVSRKREEMKWPANAAGGDGLPLFPQPTVYKGLLIRDESVHSDQGLA
ncbi:hypothetical protein B0I35DRAFT_434489 [Stachybotrys elegans]|uniref:Uncharacterized protein n=1 Tax=Stachybotrys elegans TaxID=80388 RepID=A0A8K0SQR4_9HYPO|nr:hypothetical protein B0I35DRAFT_434489 [Stachybotrys elegans]